MGREKSDVEVLPIVHVACCPNTKASIPISIVLDVRTIYGLVVSDTMLTVWNGGKIFIKKNRTTSPLNRPLEEVVWVEKRLEF